MKRIKVLKLIDEQKKKKKEKKRKIEVSRYNF